MSLEEAADFYFRRAEDLFYNRERAAEALCHVASALEIEPAHVEALILQGEIYALKGEEVGLGARDAQTRAVRSFERALAREPWNAFAWDGKALALLHMRRFREALKAADTGLLVLPLRVGYGLECPSVYRNVAESLFDVKIRSLAALGKPSAARRALSDGLASCPGSSYLTALLDDMNVLGDFQGLGNG